MMHLKGLKRAVKRIAKGRHHCVQLKISEYSNGNIVHNWSAYVADASWTRGSSTPEEALAQVEKMCCNFE